MGEGEGLWGKLLESLPPRAPGPPRPKLPLRPRGAPRPDMLLSACCRWSYPGVPGQVKVIGRKARVPRAISVGFDALNRIIVFILKA